MTKINPPWIVNKTEFEKVSEGKPRPIAIWHEGDAIAYYKATEEERMAWNAYAQRSADEFQDTLDAYETLHGYPGRDRDGKFTNWCPPLWFPEWLEARNAPSK